MNTSCYLATTSSQYREAHEYLRDRDEPKCKLSYPTLLAYRDDKIIGLMGTRPYKKAILVGPVVVNSIFVALRLAECYDKVMQLAGTVSYIFESRQSNEKWNKIMDRLPGFSRLREDDEWIQFERRLV